MKYASFFLLLFLISCQPSPLKKHLKQADSLTVHFYSSEHPDSVVKILHTTNKDAIDKLSSFIDSKETGVHVCNRDGDLVFKKDDKEIEIVEFSMLQSSCRQFTFHFNNRIVTTQMSNEAADFLTSMWAGRSYY